jgi:hypothetical protein
MRWEDESSERPLFLDFIFAKEIVYNAYREGFINWNIYNEVIKRIEKNMNKYIWHPPMDYCNKTSPNVA